MRLLRSVCHSFEELLCWLCRYTTGAYSMYSGEGTEALSTAGAATYRSEVEGAGAGAGACRGSLVQYRLLKATPSTGATCENTPISEGSAQDPLAGAEPDRLTIKEGEDI